MKTIHMTLTALLVSAASAFAQNQPVTERRTLEGGLKAGGTFTHGYTTIPAQPTGIVGVEVPQLENQSNGIGTGYSAGLWGRKNFRRGYIQAEITYNRFVLKQKTNVTLDVNANPLLAARLPLTFAPGLLNATLDATSESVLESINVPILLGRRFVNDKVRAYFGPNLIFVQKAEATRNSAGRVNANPAIGFPGADIPASVSTTNLLNRFEAANLEVKDFTYALEVGLGVSPIRSLDIDVRYAVPVGGVYKDRNIEGFLGIATVSIGYRLF